MITGKQAFKLLKNLVDINKYIKLSIEVETFEGKSKRNNNSDKLTYQELRDIDNVKEQLLYL